MAHHHKNIILVLPNIRSSENVGALFRTADAFGVSHVYCVGYTPTPLDRFGRPNTKLCKAALGAEKSISWSQEKSCEDLFLKLKSDKFELVALEQDSRSENLFEIKNISEDIALILGNEVYGIEKETLDHVDRVLEIPMLGEKESLNVSVAGGVALAHLRYLTK